VDQAAIRVLSVLSKVAYEESVILLTETGTETQKLWLTLCSLQMLVLSLYK